MTVYLDGPYGSTFLRGSSALLEGVARLILGIEDGPSSRSVQGRL